MASDVIIKALKGIVGDSNASMSEAIRQAYSRDQNYMFNEPKQPGYVVRVTNKEEIRQILKVANDNKVPIIPLGQGVNIRGLCIPTRPGSILLDLKGMNTIKEINQDMMTATIEPGVSLGQLVAACRKKGVRPAVPGAPATCSAFANYMLRGVYHHNPQDGIDHVLSMEVELPTGQTIRTGSSAISTSYGPHCRYFGPDLTGLFMGVPGAFGVITEMTVKLYDLPERQELIGFGFDDWKRASEYAIDMMKLEIPSLLWLIDWIALAVIAGFSRRQIKLKTPKAALPVCTFALLLEGTEEDVELKLGKLEKLVKRAPPDQDLRDGALSTGMFNAEEFLGGRNVAGMLKMGYYFALAFFHPMSNGAEIFEMFKDIGEKHGFERDIVSFVSTPTKSGPNNWSGQLTYSEGELFVDQTEPGVIDNLKAFSKECIETILDRRYIYSWFRPYATVLDITLERAGETGDLLRKIKNLLDPNDIMNPGKFL
ncbi:MAG: FAD-binding oxidoreductase [Candidatus Helarchaeota archaeon]|nr:FAD-binding oxidoreductase [Candidatus Helarchaeota archaeon]